MRGHEPSPIEPTFPIHVGREHGRRFYVAASLDDRCNKLVGLTVTQRYQILEAIAACVDRVLADTPDEAGRRAAFVAWVVCELFLKLRRRHAVKWGYGPLGLADPTPHPPNRNPPPGLAASTTKKRHRSRRPRLLLKNAIDTDFIDARCLRLNLPLEIRKHHRLTRQRYFGFSLNVNASLLQSKVLAVLLQRATSSPEPSHIDGLLRGFKRTGSVRLPGWPAAFTKQTLSAVLDYYDVGRSARLKHQRIYRVSYWRLGFVLESMLMHPEYFLDHMPWVTQRIRLERPKAIPTALGNAQHPPKSRQGVNPGSGLA